MTDSGATSTPSAFDNAPEQERWSWLHPRPTGNHLRAAQVAPGPQDDLWLVGDHGTLLHNGRQRESAHGVAGTTNYKAVWVLAPNNVWIAGDSNGRDSVLHWDGDTWQDGFTLASWDVRMLWGTDAKHVWALDALGGVHVWDGQLWTRGDACRMCIGAISLRDLWGSSSDDVWGVGDQGVLAHHNGVEWSPEPTEREATLRSRTYVGVWGKGPKDVWSIYVDEVATPTTIGFVHYDGSGWTTMQTAFARQGATARNWTGKRIGGTDDSVVALLDTAWVLRGKRWEREPIPFSEVHAAVANGRVFGEFGRSARLSESQWEEEGEQLADWGDVSIGEDGSMWATPRGGHALYEWRGSESVLSNTTRQVGGKWEPILTPLGTPIDMVHAHSAADIWIAGLGLRTSWVTARLHNKWTTPEELPALATGIWSDGGGVAWVVAHEGLCFRGGVGNWKPIVAPTRDDFLGVSGRSDSDVWFASQHALFHWDGRELQLAHEDLSLALTGRIAFGVQGEVWAAGRPGVSYDGRHAERLFAGADFGSESVWGPSTSDLWFVTSTAEGGELRHWNGKEVNASLRVSPRLWIVRHHPQGALWAFGERGATLHHWLSPVLR